MGPGQDAQAALYELEGSSLTTSWDPKCMELCEKWSDFRPVRNLAPLHRTPAAPSPLLLRPQTPTHAIRFSPPPISHPPLLSSITTPHSRPTPLTYTSHLTASTPPPQPQVHVGSSRTWSGAIGTGGVRLRVRAADTLDSASPWSEVADSYSDAPCNADACAIPTPGDVNL